MAVALAEGPVMDRAFVFRIEETVAVIIGIAAVSLSITVGVCAFPLVDVPVVVRAAMHKGTLPTRARPSRGC